MTMMMMIDCSVRQLTRMSFSCSTPGLVTTWMGDCLQTISVCHQPSGWTRPSISLG